LASSKLGYFRQDIFDLSGVLHGVEELSDSLLCGLAHLAAQSRLDYQAVHRTGQGVRIAHSDQKAGLSIHDDFRRSLGAGGDHRQTERPCLRQHQAERLLSGSKHQKVGLLQNRPNVFPKPEQLASVSQSQLLDRLPHLGFQGTLAYQKKSALVGLVHSYNGLQKADRILPLREPTDPNHPAPLFSPLPFVGEGRG